MKAHIPPKNRYSKKALEAMDEAIQMISAEKMDEIRQENEKALDYTVSRMVAIFILSMKQANLSDKTVRVVEGKMKDNFDRFGERKADEVADWGLFSELRFYGFDYTVPKDEI